MRAAIYVRVSTTAQGEDGSSLSTQEAACREYLTTRSWQLSNVFSDTHSGAIYRERPGLTALREQVRAGAVDVVLVYALDRLSRNQAHTYILAEEIEDHGARLAIVTEDFEDSAVGRFIRSAKAFAAEVEREKISERTMRGKLARIQSGKLLPNGKPLYGYRWRDATKGSLDIDPITSLIVQRMYKEIAEGKTLRRLAAALTEEGVPTPMGRSPQWYGSAIQVILHNHAYMGQAYAWGLRRSTKGQGQMFDPSRAIALPEGTIPALVDPELWHAVQAILTRNKQRASRNAREPEAALLRGGFASCAYCGARLSARPRSKGGYEYVCGTQRYGATRPCMRPSIMTHKLDRVAWDYATEIIMQEDVIGAELMRLRASDPTGDDLAAVDRAHNSLKRQQENISRAIALMDNAEGAAPLVAQLKELIQRARALDEERTDIEQRRAVWEDAQQQLEALELWRKRVATNLDTLTFEGRRRALDALGIHVKLYTASHQPRWQITANIPLEVGVVNTTT